ncbi:hypothetical protein A2U01_0116056, partial [Trifolium medium]|nr:hypothetical protein [Trifolium medium]
MQRNDSETLRKRMEETAITGRMTHKYTETGHPTRVTGQDIATS